MCVLYMFRASCLQLKNNYNIQNSINLAKDLTKLTIDKNYKMITYDIKDLYVNMPIEETLNHRNTTPKK
jgi:hypothetical protein